MAPSSSCPAWSSQWGHPLGSPLPSHLLLHPHCHRPPRCRLPCRGGDQPHPGQQAHRLCSHCSKGEQSAVLSNNQAQLVFRFLATSCTGQVSYSGLCTSLDKVVQILAALSPLADHVALQLPEGLKPGHQPADLPKFFWSKMDCTCVPHIVLHVSCWTRTSGGYFRPSEVRFRAKIPLSSHWFYNVKTQKTHFLKILEWADFDLLESNCRHIFLHKNQKIYHSGFFFSWYIFSSHVRYWQWPFRLFHSFFDKLQNAEHSRAIFNISGCLKSCYSKEYKQAS